MKKNYIAFIAGLPDIAADDKKLTLSTSAFRNEMLDFIKGKDLELVNLLFLPEDHAQILHLLKKEATDSNLKTVIPLATLEEEISDPSKNLPSYLREFISDYHEEHLKYETSAENTLAWMYYDYMINSKNTFISKFASFHMNLKNLITALNCRKYDKDISREIIGNNEFSEALRSSHLKDFGLTGDYPWVEKTVALFENPNLAEREHGIDLLTWNFLEEETVFEYFSIERVLAFALELKITERWSFMNSETGRQVFTEMVEKLKNTLQFDKQFN